MASERSATHLAPGFLVAAPSLRDPNFEGALVLMAGHRHEGAMGFVVNRPAPVKALDVLAGVDDSLVVLARRSGRAEHPVLVGGPVSQEQLWILYRPGSVESVDGEEEGIRVGRRLAIGSSRPLLEALLRSREPGPFLLMMGYAGWAPLQLENEIAHGAWVPLAFQEDLALSIPFETRWEEAVKRLGIDPQAFVVGGGGAMA